MAHSDFLERFLKQDDFLKDVKSFFELPTDVRERLKSLAPLTEDEVAKYASQNAKEVADELSVDSSIAYDAAMVGFVLRSAASVEHNVDDILSDLQGVVGGLVKEQDAELRQFLTLTDAEKRHIQIKRAFAEPPTFKSFDCKRIELPSPDDESDMLPGFWINLSYFDDVDKTSSARFFCTSRELRSMIDRIEQALELSGKRRRGGTDD